jgi:hypothetical protein
MESFPSANLSITNPTWLNPALRGDKPASNEVIYATDKLYIYLTDLPTTPPSSEVTVYL